MCLNILNNWIFIEQNFFRSLKHNEYISNTRILRKFHHFVVKLYIRRYAVFYVKFDSELDPSSFINGVFWKIFVQKRPIYSDIFTFIYINLSFGFGFYVLYFIFFFCVGKGERGEGGGRAQPSLDALEEFFFW